ncbi:hypothetical protein M885DRAFT_77312 [Pelagophyceae sp. CCMP2097]|nr:hypothetical protein M885DRAFT_77312 [Pelagophyceae sp. CCMP2097]
MATPWKPGQLSYDWFGRNGKRLSGNAVGLEDYVLEPMTNVLVSGIDAADFPFSPNDVGSLRLAVDGLTKWYWLTAQRNDSGPDFSEVGRMHAAKAATFAVAVLGFERTPEDVTVRFTITVPLDSPELFFYPEVALLSDSAVIEPLWHDGDAAIVLLPGETSHREFRAAFASPGALALRIGAFNAATRTMPLPKVPEPILVIKPQLD